MPQSGGNTRRCVTMPRKYTCNTETRDTSGVVRLIPRPRHDKHRPPRLHRQPGRADAAVVDDDGRSGEEFCVRSIIKGYALGAGGKPPLHTRTDEHRPIANRLCRRQTGLVEAPGVGSDRCTEGEYERWRAVIQE